METESRRTSSSRTSEGKEDEGGRSGSAPARTPSPDRVKCAICLGDIVNKSYSNTCAHQFCFGCLLEWSKVKAECPLCKSSFQIIYHNIRSNADYEEYVVPPPSAPIPRQPALSIRVMAGLSGDGRSPELLIGRSDFSFPSYTRHVNMPAAIRERWEESRMGNGFSVQLTPFGNSPNIDVTVHPRQGSSRSLSRSYQDENPFQMEAPEFFGDLLSHHGSPYGSTRFSNYQTRRRHYDRSQWVRPFESTLMPGTVFFPSIEYFQRHPSSIRRISAWLHRELTVLMSLANSRSQMAFAYDLIISLLYRYDIRSPEFRELMRPYLGSKVRQFQHEFYHFVLSGMRVEEYDRVASYPPNSSTLASAASAPVSSTNTATSTSATLSPAAAVAAAAAVPAEEERNPATATPPIVTIDSSDDDANDSGDVIFEDIQPRVRSLRRSNTAFHPIRAHGIPSPPYPYPSRSPSPEPEVVQAVMQRFQRRHRPPTNTNNNDADNVTMRASPSLPSDSSFEFPRIDLMSDIINPLSTSTDSGSRQSRLRLRNPDPPTPPRLRLRDADTRSRERERTQSQAGNVDLNNLSFSSTNNGSSAFRRVREREASSSSRSNRGNTLQKSFDDLMDNLDPEDGRRSPYPRIDPEFVDLLTTTDIGYQAQRTSTDFPILGLRETVERNNRRSQRLRETETEAESRRRLHSSGSSHIPGSAEVSIFPPALDLSQRMDLSNLLGRHSSGPTVLIDRHRSTSVIQQRPRTPSPPVDNEDCEFLGVHPIIKKPPLAVITLSSEDEGNGDENDDNARLTPQPGPSSAMRLTFSTYPESQDSNSQTLQPPKRRHGSPPGGIRAILEYLRQPISHNSSASTTIEETRNSRQVKKTPSKERNKSPSPPKRQKTTNTEEQSSSTTSPISKRRRRNRRSPPFEIDVGNNSNSILSSLPQVNLMDRHLQESHAGGSGGSSSTRKTRAKKSFPTSLPPLEPLLTVPVPPAPADRTRSKKRRTDPEETCYYLSTDSDLDLSDNKANDGNESTDEEFSFSPPKSKKLKKSRKPSKKPSKSSEKKKKDKKKEKKTTSKKSKVSSEEPTNRRVKSVVVKVKKSRQFISSSEGSSTEENESVSPKAKIRSVIKKVPPSSSTASSSRDMTLSGGGGGTSSSHDLLTPTPSSAAMDLTATYTSSGSTPYISSSLLHPVTTSRRWESDDEDDAKSVKKQEYVDSDDISVGNCNEDARRASDTDSDSEFFLGSKQERVFEDY